MRSVVVTMPTSLVPETMGRAWKVPPASSSAASRTVPVSARVTGLFSMTCSRERV